MQLEEGDVRYTCSPGLSGDGNITNDPQFVDAANSDYHLQASSPCIDAGNNAYMPSGPDLDGVPRPLDGDTNGTAVVDMGCYEHLNEAADSDGDGLTDGDEINTHGTDPTDVNTDGDPHTDYEEYVADTDGANPNDYFRITAISNNSPFTVYYDSSSNRWYTMIYCSNLMHAAWTNVPGTDTRKGIHGPDSMDDTNVPSKGPFYRMEVGL